MRYFLLFSFLFIHLANAEDSMTCRTLIGADEDSLKVAGEQKAVLESFAGRSFDIADTTGTTFEFSLDKGELFIGIRMQSSEALITSPIRFDSPAFVQIQNKGVVERAECEFSADNLRGPLGLMIYAFSDIGGQLQLAEDLESAVMSGSPDKAPCFVAGELSKMSELTLNTLEFATTKLSSGGLAAYKQYRLAIGKLEGLCVDPNITHEEFVQTAQSISINLPIIAKEFSSYSPKLQ